MAKFQVPVVGGLRKVVQTSAAAAASGTTIAGYGNQTLTLQQLKSLLGGVTTTTTPNTITPGATASLIPGSGLSGGGPLVGAVSLRLAAPIPVFFDSDGGSGDDGPPGPPGVRGADGAAGGQGPLGPAVLFIADDPLDGLDGVPGPQGTAGAAGAPGAQGIPGAAVLFIGDDAQDGLDGVPGPQGATGATGAPGATGAAGAALFLLQDAPEEPMMVYYPQAAVVSGGGGASATENITPDSHPASPATADDEFESGSLDTGGTRRAGALAWTTVNLTYLTLTQDKGAMRIDATKSPPLMGGFYQSIAGGAAWKYRAKVKGLHSVGYSAEVGGILLYESGTGKYAVASFLNNPGFNLWLAYFAALNSASQTGYVGFPYAVPAKPSPWGTQSEWLYMEIELLSGSIYMRASQSGDENTFLDVGNLAVTTMFTTAPDKIGIGAYNFGGTGAFRTYVDWFRRIA
jgi:hypothetical protein